MTGFPPIGEDPESENVYQARTTPEKLAGRYYTPPALARFMLQHLDPAARDVLVDPACGDGVFLHEAVGCLRERGVSGAALAECVASRFVGFDSDGGALALARQKLAAAVLLHSGISLSSDSLRLFQSDPLDLQDRRDLGRAAGAIDLASGRLLVVGNPPYVEAKRLRSRTRAELRERMPDATQGAPDLYLYFLHCCGRWLETGDALCFVVPNRVLANRSALRLRRSLLEQNRLTAVWFAGLAGVFKGAAVYPVVLSIAGPSALPRPVEVRHLTRSGEDLFLGDAVQVAPSLYRKLGALPIFPVPVHAGLREVLERLLEASRAARLDDALEIRWTVSFHRAGLRDRYVSFDPAPGRDRRWVRMLGARVHGGNGEVGRYRLEWAGGWMDYAEEQLRGDENSVPPRALFERPKVVICQYGRTLRATWDDQGFVLKDIFLAGTPVEPRLGLPAIHSHPRALVGLLCSALTHFFYSHVFHGGHLNGGYLHFLGNFLREIPLGEWTPETAARLEQFVAQRERCDDAAERSLLEAQIESVIGTALDLDPASFAQVQEWAEAEPNWQLRERTRRAQTSDSHRRLGHS